VFETIQQILLQNLQDDWRIVSAIACAVSVASLVSLIVLPESPSWLLSKGRQTDAEESLMKLRGNWNIIQILLYITC
jgi:hypothetical protein